MARHRVVIVGGGFGGLNAARALRRAPVAVTLVDRRNHHLFQPLLYQVATGGLSPANIAGPLRSVLKRQRNARVFLGEVVDFAAAAREVVLADGQRLPWDTLIVAAGASHNYFGRDEWAELAPGLKTLEDATEIRSRILLAFEAAERETDPARAAAWLTFAVVGAGATGVELAGALSEIARDTLRHDFRAIDPAAARILLVDAADRALPGFPAALSARGEQALARMGVTVRRRTTVAAIAPEAVTLRGEAGEETIACRTVLWAAGVRASPLGARLAAAFDAALDRAGRVVVRPDLTLPGRDDVMVIGDLAACAGRDGRPLPGVAQVAIQQGRHAARAVVARLRGTAPAPFRYRDFGNLATIGRHEAVADLPWVRTAGRLAWFLWLFVHLVWLVQFHNRLLVMLQWAWNYFTHNRTARLITGEGRLPPVAVGRDRVSGA